MSSSDRPSEKYSWSFFSLRSAKGSTATDLSDFAVDTAVPGGSADAASLAGAARFESQNLSART